MCKAFFGKDLSEFHLTCTQLSHDQFDPHNHEKNYLENLFGFSIVSNLLLTAGTYQEEAMKYELSNGISIDLTRFCQRLFELYDQLRGNPDLI